jgi:hypothetical protein
VSFGAGLLARRQDSDLTITIACMSRRLQEDLLCSVRGMQTESKPPQALVSSGSVYGSRCNRHYTVGCAFHSLSAYQQHTIVSIMAPSTSETVLEPQKTDLSSVIEPITTKAEHDQGHQEELDGLPHVIAEIPGTVWVIALILAAERFAYWGIITPWRESARVSRTGGIITTSNQRLFRKLYTEFP